LEQAYRAARTVADEQRTAVTAVQQEIQVAAAESRGVGERIDEGQIRRDRIAAESRGLIAVDTVELAAAQQRASSAAQRVVEARARVATLEGELPRLDEARRSVQAEAEAESARRADLSARLDALQALQQQVQVDARVRPWLERHGLTSLAGLWTRLRIDAGWEAALESALRERMGALEIGRLDTVAAFAADAPPARLAFFTPAAVPPSPARLGLPRLSDRLHLGDAGLAAQLADWLEGVYTAADLAAALAERGVLAHGEVIMTPEGHAVSRSAVSFYAPDSEQAGLLARAQQIEQLGKELRAQSLLAEDARARHVAAEAASSEALGRLGVLRRELADSQVAAHRLEVEAVALTQRAEQTGLRHDQLAAELQAIDAELAELGARRSGSEARFDLLDASLGEVQEEHAMREARVIDAQAALTAASEALRNLERRVQEAEFERRVLHSRRDELARNIEVATGEVAANLEADSGLGSELDRLAASAPGDELDLALAARLESERRLGEQRSRYDDLAQQLRRADEARLAHAQALQPLRDKVGALQLEEQAAQLGGAQYVEQLDAAAADRDAIAAAIEQGGVKLSGLQSLIDSLHREVESLGAVNLAALDELTTGRERKEFLDAQNADLSEAMATLEDAIKKIDRETRELLGTTFDQVNDHFGRMFPLLFGGGTARLAMTGDEILDAGVQVLAQPPGKKNSSIHLLSGGEKALTAIALVFAIFQLNPAPFCLLDEVDAPLDDANTERYAKLVTEMSATTQFLFISHNRIAMEMAEQLIGVTMQEQGVSRIVTVDVPAALQLAEAA
ncbi:MAG: chromosome segregation protein SMC, partial [Pseudomonadota bacterium]|nr:chromosome segregation protein SMC [Pseudomonadota bacterium]